VGLADDVQADLEFHDTICSLAGNATLYRAWSDITGLIRISMTAAGPGPARENMAFDRHRPIVDLIDAGDAEEAHRFMEKHMATALELLIKRMESRTN
jgi:DNA-binding FadR family transcriptional regulator